MDILNDITKTTVKLLIKEPFYGHFFTYIHRSVSDKVERVSLKLNTDGRLFLVINPSYWQSLTIQQQFGCIKHQILHLVFRHIYQTETYADKNRFNIASDFVVNQYLSSEQCSNDAYRVENYPFLLLEKGQSLGYYYTKLKQYGSSNQQIDQPFSSEEQDETNRQATNEISNGETKNSLDGKSNATPKSEHQEWNSFDEQSGAQKKFVEEKLDSYAAQSADRLSSNDFGLLPAKLKTQITEARERLQPVVQWKRMLRLYIQTSRKTYIKSTLKRPSRRYGTIPGTQIKQRQKILVAIDTSGSIDTEELNRFFSEVYHIWRQAAEIEIVECDVNIHRQYSYKGHNPKVVAGGGGTYFDPPIEFANKTRPDVLIYFTDGYANAPKIKCNCAIIWVITAEGITSNEWDFLPGRKLKLSK